MNRATFLKALSKQLYPILRSEGFRGSGITLRRINDPIIHIFNFQGSTSSERCYLNLGAHLMFLERDATFPVPASKILESQCAFRNRFDPPAGHGFGWSYGNTETEMTEQIRYICEHWCVDAQGYFNQYSIFPDNFVNLIDNALNQTRNSIECKTLALIAIEIGMNKKASLLAQIGLKNCPRIATALQNDLNRILTLANHRSC